MMKRPIQQSLPVLAFSRSRGFTLLEIMVVVLIIGIIMTFAAMTVSSGGDRRVEQEAKRFTGLMRLAVDQSILNAQDIVVSLKKSSYEFFWLAPDGKPVAIEDESSPFRTRELPDDVELQAEIDGEEMILTDSDDDNKRNPALIYVLASGELSPFSVEVKRVGEPGLLVTGDYPGNVEFKGKVEQ